MNDKVNLAAKFAAFDDHWIPRIVGELNDYKIVVVKGHLTIQLRTIDTPDVRRSRQVVLVPSRRGSR